MKVEAKIEGKDDRNPSIIRIPKSIRKDIEKKGFHLYKWISPDEVKLSIEKDFLKVLSIVGIPLAIFSVLVGLLSGLKLSVFFLSIIFGVVLIFLYLFFLSIRRSVLLSKSAFVVITDSSISLGGKITKLSEISEIKEDITTVSTAFEEDLFGESGLSHSKTSLGEKVLSQLFGGYKTIFKAGDSFKSRDSAQGVLVLIALYTLYIAIMACVYFIGVFFLLLLGKIFIWLNKKYLLKRGAVVIKINELFGDLDIVSEEIYSEKKSLEKLLKDAQQNEWKDGLLLAINDGIKGINTHAQNAIISSLDLRNTIKSSKYNDMFSYEIYNAWIKKQISNPLSQILELLQGNLDILTKSKKSIIEQIEHTDKVELESVLKLQLKRVNLQILEVKRYIPMLEESLKKLQ